MSKPLISIQNITVNFPTTQALCDVKFEIYPGEFIGICGPNGSGKTTLLKSILGLVKLDKGKILLNGKDINDHQQLHADIGYVPQLKTVDVHFPAKVSDIIMMGRTPRIGYLKRPDEKDKKIVQNILSLLNLEEIAENPIGQISGGQFQKVLLGRALAQQPKILLLDEPTSALDFRMTKSFMEIIKKLNDEQHLTIVSVHHDLQLLKDYAKRIICMDRTIEWEGESNDADLDKELLRLFYYRSPH